jgi:hypothetical protein
MSDICFCFRISNDSSFAKNIGGVLVEQGMDSQIKLKGKCRLLLVIILFHPDIVGILYSYVMLNANSECFSLSQDFLQTKSSQELNMHLTKASTMNGTQLYDMLQLTTKAS